MKELHAAIITIGDELLIGQTVDTNSAFIGRELNRIGIWVKRRLAVGDLREEILEALDSQGRECQLVIITGGLGPTADDITKPTLCEFFGSNIIVNEEVRANVIDIFSKLDRPITERNLKQAEVPHNCIVLPNKRGTAPGMWFEKEGVIYVSLPGVPNEMQGLIQYEVVPRLQQAFELAEVVHRTLLVAGVGESTVADLVSDFEAALPSYIKLAYLPSYRLLRLRLTGRGETSGVKEAVDAAFNELKPLVSEWLVAEEDISLPLALKQLLDKKSKTVCTAESCTGGLIASQLTSEPGSSSIFKGGIVAYDNEIKKTGLGVKEETLQSDGAVSEATVLQMAEGALRFSGADYVIATSGIMGPGGGSEAKPVGTVWIAVGRKGKISASRHFFRFDRSRNTEMTAQAALILLWRAITAD